MRFKLFNNWKSRYDKSGKMRYYAFHKVFDICYSTQLLSSSNKKHYHFDITLFGFNFIWWSFKKI